MSSSIPRIWTSIMQNPTIPTKFAALPNATKIHCKIQSTFGVKWPIKLASLRPPCLGSMITSIIWVQPQNVVYFLRKIIQQFILKNGRVIRDLTNPRFLLISVRFFWKVAKIAKFIKVAKITNLAKCMKIAEII